MERLSPSGDLPALPEQITAGLPSDLLRRLRDIRSAPQCNSPYRSDTAQLFPRFSLTGNVNWQSSPETDYPSTPTQPPAKTLCIAPVTDITATIGPNGYRN